MRASCSQVVRSKVAEEVLFMLKDPRQEPGMEVRQGDGGEVGRLHVYLLMICVISLWNLLHMEPFGGEFHIFSSYVMFAWLRK
jgi:hypothetical protein